MYLKVMCGTYMQLQPLQHGVLLIFSTLSSLTDALCLCSRLTVSAKQLPRAGHPPCDVSYFTHCAVQESLLSCDACCTDALCTATRPCTKLPLCRLCGVPWGRLLCTGLSLPRTVLPDAPQVDLQYWGPAVVPGSQQTPV